MRRFFLPTLLLALGPHLASASGPDESPRVRLAPGFRMELCADQSLADDIQAMTLDRHGRVVVTGPGYVKTLHTDPATGRAVRATVFAKPRTGGMGLCFVGDDLFVTAEGWLSRYRDADGDGAADGPPERIVPLAYGEHGGHAIRKGPDGWLYVIGGNDAGINERHVGTKESPVTKPVAGGIIRLSPDLKSCEVVAHGFRNPYDFDFNPLGAIFAYDSDCERDVFLPWSTPTRLFEVAEGGHHGWRLTGYQRSFARSPNLFDAIPPVADLGRGSPTGVVCYRHALFPESYRDGLFLADWTFGRIYFLGAEPPKLQGFSRKPQVFIEPIGGEGFAPTDLCVDADGALLVSVGGRKTRGAVYRIKPEPGTSDRPGADRSDLDRVLHAWQPLDAWSRDRWEPIARRLGPGPFLDAMRDDRREETERLRAVEVLADLFDGLDSGPAESAWKTAPDSVRTRIAWALDRRRAGLTRPANLPATAPTPSLSASLIVLASRGRLDGVKGALWDGAREPSPRIIPALERMVRSGASLTREDVVPATDFQSPWDRLNRALVVFHESSVPDADIIAIRAAMKVLDDPDRRGRDEDYDHIRANALRLLVVALGDWNIDHARADAFVPYSLSRPITLPDREVEAIRERLRRIFPTNDARLDEEASRVLAMLGDDRESNRRAVAAKWTGTSTATSDLHYLIVSACLRGPIPRDLTPRMAEAFCRLDAKLEGKPGRIKQTWNDRVGEVAAMLTESDPALVDALVARPDFAAPGQAAWAARIGGPARAKVAEAFLAATSANAEFEINGPVLELLDAVPRARLKPLLRGRWDRLSVKDDALLRLAEGPEAADRARFLDGLDSASPRVVSACLAALESLPPSHEPADVVPALRLLRRLTADPKASPLRRRVAAWAAREQGRPAADTEPADPAKTVAHYSALIDAFAREHPRLATALNAPGDDDPASWATLMSTVDWKAGDAARGASVFRARQCAGCHEGAGALGPDLAGVGRRLSRDDLYAAIVAPSRDIAPAYRPLLIEMNDGRAIAGFLVFESAEALIVRTGPSTSERIDGAAIAARRPAPASLMPAGLLRGASEREIADLYAYMKGL